MDARRRRRRSSPPSRHRPSERAHDGPDGRDGHAGAPVGHEGRLSLDRAHAVRARPRCGARAPAPSRSRRPHAARREPEPPRQRPRRSQGGPGHRVAPGLDGARRRPATASLTDIAVKGMDLGPVLVDYLCQPYAVTGPLDLCRRGVASAARRSPARDDARGRWLRADQDRSRQGGRSRGRRRSCATWSGSAAPCPPRSVQAARRRPPARLRLDHRHVSRDERRGPHRGPRVQGAGRARDGRRDLRAR